MCKRQTQGDESIFIYEYVYKWRSNGDMILLKTETVTQQFHAVPYALIHLKFTHFVNKAFILFLIFCCIIEQLSLTGQLFIHVFNTGQV